MLEIDGSHGEGGGAIVRLSAAFSALTGKACRIERIRAGRETPGLQRQHVAAVDAVAKLCDAKVRGSYRGSQSLLFTPGELKPGTLDIDVGSAGSIALVLQALMIPAMKYGASLKIRGGTVNKWAPSVVYIRDVTMPILKKFGYAGEVSILKHGFYPEGGGIVEAKLMPCSLKRIDMPGKGALLRMHGTALAGKSLAGAKVAERMKRHTEEILKAYKPEIKAEYCDSLSPGGGIDMVAEYENSFIGAGAVAEKNRNAEGLANEACQELLRAHEDPAAVDVHMADQILPYLAIAGGSVSVPSMTPHCQSNIYVIEKFTGKKIACREEKGVILLAV
ncbi:MAG: RNA 3'-phosphate cyclase [Candidatus Aenigmarchaeota archaeon]|nr:RNA 3'-phosphate cyclase [Candidatus Aenigmarchaeota archaeon]